MLFSGLEFVSVPKILVWRDHFVMPLEVQVDVDMEFASMGKKILRMKLASTFAFCSTPVQRNQPRLTVKAVHRTTSHFTILEQTFE